MITKSCLIFAKTNFGGPEGGGSFLLFAISGRRGKFAPNTKEVGGGGGVEAVFAQPQDSYHNET